MSRQVQRDVFGTLRRAHERQLGPGWVVEIVERDPERREVWADVTEREGSLAGAIAAIHREMVDTGWKRPLTHLLDAGEAAVVFGVTRPTFRGWLRKGKLRHLTRVGVERSLFREDELRFVASHGRP